MSPTVRTDFLNGGGFCALHFAMAMDIEEECWQAGGIGMAILCEDVVHRAMAAAEQMPSGNDGPRMKSDRFEPGAACIFCEERRRKERALVEVLEELADEEEFNRPIKDGRLCLRHVRLAHQSWAEPAKREWLKTALSQRASQLLDDLRELIRKYDYQFKNEPKGREQNSVLGCAEFLFGTGYARKKAVP